MPVYTSNADNYRDLDVGRRIREYRQRKQLTLHHLASKVHISEAKLSNIENGKVSLDLDELSRISQELDAPVTAFFPPTEVRHHLIKRGYDLPSEPPVAHELTGFEPGPLIHHNPVWSLAEPFVGRHLEPLLARIHPLPDNALHFIAHDHEEFMFVLSGEVETLLKTNDGLVAEVLRAGDSMYFRSNLPHCHRSASREIADTLNIIHSLRGTIDFSETDLGVGAKRYYRRGVYTDVSHKACEKIGLLRRSHGMTLAELAASIDVGVRELASIERGIRAPDVALLLCLARRFHRPIEYFFSTTLENWPYFIVERGDDLKKLPIRYVWSNGNQRTESLFRALASKFSNKLMYPYHLKLLAADKLTGSMMNQYSGEEFIYVLEGEVELEICTSATVSSIEVLHAGDSLYLDSSVPHNLRCRSRNPYAETVAEVICVFWSPLGEDYFFRGKDANG